MRRVMLFQWHVTERCNLHCTHCYQQLPLPREMTWPEMLRVLDQFEGLASQLGRAAHVTVTGGEYFLHSSAWKLLAVLSGRFPFAVLTNGMNVDAGAAARLTELRPRFVQLSVEGTQETHDQIRGAGSYARTVDAARELTRAGVPTLLAFTAHQDNYREFTHVARLGRKLGVTRVWADRLIPTGAETSLRTLEPAQTRELFQIMRFEHDPHYKTEVAMHRALQFLEGGSPYRCTAGSSLLAIQPDGDVYPCRRMPIRVGNLLGTPLVDIYKDSAVLLELRDESRVPDGCQGCEHVSKCGGGLRCLAYAVTGRFEAADPGCWLTQDRKATQAGGQPCGAGDSFP